jgi:hypothetical protein
VFAGFLIAMLLNVFWHVGVAIYFRAYAPGVVTAIAINLPVMTYLLHRAITEQKRNSLHD